MRIFRIQNERGDGMYFGGSSASQRMMDLESRHPAPRDDVRLKQAVPGEGWYRFKYGFGSLDQLRSWVYKQAWRDMLQSEGFHVVEIDTPCVYYGDTQAVWPEDNPRDIIRRISWEEISEPTQKTGDEYATQRYTPQSGACGTHRPTYRETCPSRRHLREPIVRSTPYRAGILHTA